MSPCHWKWKNTNQDNCGNIKFWNFWWRIFIYKRFASLAGESHNSFTTEPSFCQQLKTHNSQLLWFFFNEPWLYSSKNLLWYCVSSARDGTSSIFLWSEEISRFFRAWKRRNYSALKSLIILMAFKAKVIVSRGGRRFWRRRKKLTRLKSIGPAWILTPNKGYSQMATLVANGRERIPLKSSLCFAYPAKKACSPSRDLNQISLGHQKGWIDSVPLTVLSLKAAVKGNTRFSTITSRSLIFSNFALSASYCFEISSALSWKNKTK